MTSAQFNEYQRQAEVIEQAKKWEEERKSKEISDEEIEKAIDAYFPKTDINARWGWKLGCEWYREQLKNK